MDIRYVSDKGASFLSPSYTIPNRMNRSTIFSDLMNNKSTSTNNSASSESSLKEMWEFKFPGSYYHVMDASKIPNGIWERNDFPCEKFFSDDVDESTLSWTPSGPNPAMTDSHVQSRLNSTLGGKSILVPPELEEKMKNNPTLAKKVMENIDNFIASEPTRPGRILSYLISLDENGNIAHYRVTGGGSRLTGPSPQELRQFEAEQKARREKKAKAQKEELDRIQKAADERRLEADTYRQNSIESALYDQMNNGYFFAFGDPPESMLAAYGMGIASTNTFQK